MVKTSFFAVLHDSLTDVGLHGTQLWTISVSFSALIQLNSFKCNIHHCEACKILLYIFQVAGGRGISNVASFCATCMHPDLSQQKQVGCFNESGFPSCRKTGETVVMGGSLLFFEG